MGAARGRCFAGETVLLLVTDVPPTPDECHHGSCEGGPPHQIAVDAGTPCNGTMTCDGFGTCSHRLLATSVIS